MRLGMEKKYCVLIIICTQYLQYNVNDKKIHTNTSTYIARTFSQRALKPYFLACSGQFEDS